VLFANACIGEFAPPGEITEEHFDRQFGINVRGTPFTVQKALPPRLGRQQLRQRRRVFVHGSAAQI